MKYGIVIALLVAGLSMGACASGGSLSLSYNSHLTKQQAYERDRQALRRLIETGKVR